ncbi:MAG TPA: trypsin-like peptidase domain-containing protein [Trichocoleus sp.]
MTQAAGLNAQELIELIQNDPEVKQALLQALKDERKRKKSASTPTAGNDPIEPEPAEPEPIDATQAQFQKLMLEAIQQIAANSAEQKRTAAKIYRSVQNTQALAKEIRTVKKLGRDAKEVGEVAVLAIALTSFSLFVLVCTAIVLKNAVMDAIGSMNPFKSNSSTPAQWVNLDFPGIYDGGEVAGIPVTSNFGMRVHPLTGQDKMHEGADLGTDSGTPLYAPAAGTVTCNSDSSGYGTYAEMSLPNGDSILLGHLTDCIEGAATVGKTIATSGNSGGSTAPHLHLELHKAGQPVQPTIDVALGVTLGVDYLKVRELTAKYYGATVSQESGGSHEAQNDRTAASGLTQIMPENIPAWSQNALGRSVSQDEFLGSPDLQKNISLYKMAEGIAQQLKASNGDDNLTLRRMAATWYSGSPERERDYSPLPYPGEPSVGDYVDSVLAKIAGHLGTDAPVPPPSAKEELERVRAQQSQAIAPTSNPAQSVVCVEALKANGASEGCASGVVVGSGQVLTAYHVINQANGQAIPIHANGQILKATIARTDSTKDLALLQVEGLSLPAVAMGNNPTQGQALTIVGFPEAAGGQQVSKNTTVDDASTECGISIPCIGVAPGTLAPGFSGGAAFSNGQLIGMNRAIRKLDQVGVIVPIADVQQFLQP